MNLSSFILAGILPAGYRNVDLGGEWTGEKSRQVWLKVWLIFSRYIGVWGGVLYPPKEADIKRLCSQFV